MKFTSAIAATVSGSIGGATGSHNRGGQYFRRRAIPTNPNTSLQVVRRASMGLASVSWTSILTQAQRNGWNAYANATPVIDSLGNTIRLTGLNMYARQAVLRIAAGMTPIFTPPEEPGLTDLTPVTISDVESDSSITGTHSDEDDWAGSADGFLAIFASASMSAGKTFFKGPYRYFGKVLGNSVTPPTITINMTNAAFTFTLGQKVGVRVIACDGFGRLSQAQEYLMPVTAP